jgi:hypothetical protein
MTTTIPLLGKADLRSPKIAIEIPVFSGNSTEDVDNWFYKLENCFKLYGVKDDEGKLLIVTAKVCQVWQRACSNPPSRARPEGV